MSCPHCSGLERLFDQKTAARDLKSYRKKGPDKSTRLLIEALKAEDVTGATLLDIGGGIGAIQHELLQAGIRQAIDVDASPAYIEAARTEAERQGHAERVIYHRGNFVELADEIEAVNIVTLDRAICCYPDMPVLVGASAKLAQNLYGLVYPRDTWWLKLAARLLNGVMWLQRNPFRFFVHPSEAVNQVISHHGLELRFYRRTFFWQIVVYGR